MRDHGPAKAGHYRYDHGPAEAGHYRYDHGPAEAGHSCCWLGGGVPRPRPALAGFDSTDTSVVSGFSRTVIA